MCVLCCIIAFIISGCPRHFNHPLLQSKPEAFTKPFEYDDKAFNNIIIKCTGDTEEQVKKVQCIQNKWLIIDDEGFVVPVLCRRGTVEYVWQVVQQPSTLKPTEPIPNWIQCWWNDRTLVGGRPFPCTRFHNNWKPGMQLFGTDDPDTSTLVSDKNECLLVN